MLIRLDEARHRPVTEQIRELLQAADVQYACEYSIFGYWDALIRVWLNNGALHRLTRLLDDKHKHIYNVQKFEIFYTAEIRYLWSGNERNLLDDDHDVLNALSRRKKQIENLVAAPNEPDKKSQSLLAEEGLLIDRDHTDVDRPGVKFYIGLERVGGDLIPDGEPMQVLKAIKKCAFVNRATLYSGHSHFAAYLVRCVTDAYHEVLDASACLDIQLSGTRLRPLTLLVANTDAPESDCVNHPKSLSQRAERMLTLLDFHEESLKFATHDAADWEALDDLVNHAHELAGTDKKLLATLISILRACMRDDHDELARATSFLSDSEWFIGKYVIYAWRVSLGENWFNQLKEVFDADPKLARSAEELRKGEEHWTAGSYAHLAKETANVSEEFDARLKRQLMQDWKRQIMRYYERRNEPVHGKFRSIPHLDVFKDKAHRTRICELMETSVLCWHARRVVEGGEDRRS